MPNTRVELDPEKRYFTIGEVSTHLGVNTSLIRFWEKEFPQIQPKKSSGGSRMFRREDLELLERIYYLVKERGFTLEGARKKLREKTPANDHRDQIRARLLELRSRLEQLRELL
ncbi:MerR family transcriptional regulator [bacterium]|nr:MerR family transcriptional regulator [bacterium]